MKSLFRKFSIVLIVMTIEATSCSKDDDSTPPPLPTTTELLAHKWFYVKTEDSSTTPPTVTLADTCTQNIYFNFLDDGNLLVENFSLNMISNCVSGGIIALTYSISVNEEQIIVISGMVTETWTIEVLTETEFAFSNDSGKAFFER